MMKRPTLSKPKCRSLPYAILIVFFLLCIHQFMTARRLLSDGELILSAPDKMSDNGESSLSAPDKIEFPDNALLRTAGDGWKLVDFTDASFRSDLNYSCEFVPFKSTKGQVAEICVHTTRDLVSNQIRRKMRWGDCDPLPKLWEDNASAEMTKKQIYVEIGANIGSCVVEMLLSTNANIVAFEPHPMNQLCLHHTLARLGPEYQRRVALVPAALGGNQAVSQIYTGEGNMGNSVVGKAIKDFLKQSIQAPVDIRVERLDSILSDKIAVPLVKLDAQGFECQILDGTSKNIAKHVSTIKFEMASKWLRKQNCLDLLPRLRKLNFTISTTDDVVDADTFNCGVCDLYARSNVNKKIIS